MASIARVDHQAITSRYAPLWPVVNWTLFGIGALYAIALILRVVPGYDGPTGPLGVMIDAEAYYTATWADPYANSTAGAHGAYLYSPAFLVAIEPLRWLPSEGFMAVWTALHFAAIAWLAPWMAIFPGAIDDVVRGNINTFLAVMLVVAVRHPAAWSSALLTKVTPAIGMAWHLARREWSSLAIAGLVTLAIAAAVTAVTGVDVWADWIASLRGHDPSRVLVRVPLAALVIALGAWRWPWLLPVGVIIGMDAPALSAFALLAAIPRLSRRESRTPAGSRAG